jgi:hypothetical protein
MELSLDRRDWNLLVGMKHHIYSPLHKFNIDMTSLRRLPEIEDKCKKLKPVPRR